MTGIFHTGGVDDGFRLPVIKSYRTCRVEVRLSDDQGVAAETGSWDGALADVRELNAACRKVPSFAWKWGRTKSGSEGKILVSLVRNT